MAFRLTLTRAPKLTVAEVSGLAFFEDAPAVLMSIERETREHGDTRLLLNLLDVVGTFGPAEHQQLGEMVARHLSHLEKVASLVPADKITRISERAAEARGMQLRVFTTLIESVGWLVE